MMRSAMHDAMTHGDQGVRAKMTLRPCDDGLQQRLKRLIWIRPTAFRQRGPGAIDRAR